jgi:hypothetical protein
MLGASDPALRRKQLKHVSTTYSYLMVLQAELTEKRIFLSNERMVLSVLHVLLPERLIGHVSRQQRLAAELPLRDGSPQQLVSRERVPFCAHLYARKVSSQRTSGYSTYQRTQQHILDVQNLQNAPEVVGLKTLPRTGVVLLSSDGSDVKAAGLHSGRRLSA